MILLDHFTVEPGCRVGTACSGLDLGYGGVRGAPRQRNLASSSIRLPPVLPCLPWLIDLFVAIIFIVFCRTVGHFLKFLFLSRWFCKRSDKALVVALACGALIMCLRMLVILKCNMKHRQLIS